MTDHAATTAALAALAADAPPPAPLDPDALARAYLLLIHTRGRDITAADVHAARITSAADLAAAAEILSHGADHLCEADVEDNESIAERLRELAPRPRRWYEGAADWIGEALGEGVVGGIGDALDGR